MTEPLSSLKLGDLESAEKTASSLPDASPNHDFRTVGTKMFWSVEVENHRYRFLPEEDPFTAPSRTSKRLPLFWHNPLHDCESIWWMMVYIFALEVVRSDRDPHWSPKEQSEKLNLAFPRGFRTAARSDFLMVDGVLHELFQDLEVKLAVAEDGLDNLRKFLWQAFRQSEKLLPGVGIDEDAWKQYNPLHRAMEHQLELLHDQTSHTRFRAVPNSSTGDQNVLVHRG